jgi:hypothetical protein
VPRWALLPREERAVAQAIAEGIAASAFGIILLEEVIDAVVKDGMDRPAAMRWMAEPRGSSDHRRRAARDFSKWVAG